MKSLIAYFLSNYCISKKWALVQSHYLGQIQPQIVRSWALSDHHWRPNNTCSVWFLYHYKSNFFLSLSSANWTYITYFFASCVEEHHLFYSTFQSTYIVFESIWFCHHIFVSGIFPGEPHCNYHYCPFPFVVVICMGEMGGLQKKCTYLYKEYSLFYPFFLSISLLTQGSSF